MLNIIIIIFLLILLYFYEEEKNSITENLQYLPCIKMQENCKIAFIAKKYNNSDEEILRINNYKNYCKNCSFSLFVYDKIFANDINLNKILMIKKIMKNEKYKYIIWMDTKKPIKNLIVSFERMINKYDKSNIIFPYNGNIVLDYFIIKNCPWSKSMIDKLEEYIENNIKNTNINISNHIKSVMMTNKYLGIEQKIKLVDISEFDEIINDKKISKESAQSK